MGSWCLLPPALILFCALTTRKVIPSLLVGLLSASFMAKEFDVIEAIQYVFITVGDVLDVHSLVQARLSPDSNWKLFTFIVSLSVIIVMLQKSGAVNAFTSFLSRRVRCAHQAQKASLLMPFFFFIDDYFSSFSVGKIMLPLTDKYKVSRAKLAFIVDSMAAPLTVLCPVSSWVGVVIGFLANSGVGTTRTPSSTLMVSPLSVFLSMMPFLFYSFMIIAAAWFLVGRKISYGYMGVHDRKARESPLETQKNQAQSPILHRKKATLVDFFVIWFLTIFSLIFAFLYHGQWALLGGHHSFVTALSETEVAPALFMSGCFAPLATSLYFLKRGIFKIQWLPRLFYEGFQLMSGALLILVISWSVGGIIRDDLMIGPYLAQTIMGSFSLSWLPLTIFVVAFLTSFATGSSWGTAALFFPIVIAMMVDGCQSSCPVTLEALPFLVPALGALMSGCLAGDHISPISDTTIMTAISTEMSHVEHVKTQFTYAMPCIFFTGLAYAGIGILPASLSVPLRVSVALGLSFLCLALFYTFSHHREAKKRDQATSC